MFSVNVPVPGRVKRLASELHPQLVAFDRVREDHTIVCKRLEDPAPGGHAAIEGRVRRALADTPPFTARVDGLGVFERPPSGPGPVVYLAIESPGLRAAHERLCEVVDPVPVVEGGDDYTPHVTLARGGTMAQAEAFTDQAVEPVEWTVDALAFWRRGDGGAAGRVPLPA